MTAKPTTPKGLGTSGAAFWRDVLAKYELRIDEQRVLEDACRERDLIARLEAELAGATLLTKGSMGQPVVNPLVSELRQHRGTFAALMRQLKLPDEDSTDHGGALSAKNRAAVQARWARRGA